MNAYLLVAYSIFLGGMILYQLFLLIQKKMLIRKLEEIKEKLDR